MRRIQQREQKITKEIFVGAGTHLTDGTQTLLILATTKAVTTPLASRLQAKTKPADRAISARDNRLSDTPPSVLHNVANKSICHYSWAEKYYG